MNRELEYTLNSNVVDLPVPSPEPDPYWDDSERQESWRAVFKEKMSKDRLDQLERVLFGNPPSEYLQEEAEKTDPHSFVNGSVRPAACVVDLPILAAEPARCSPEWFEWMRETYPRFAETDDDFLERFDRYIVHHDCEPEKTERVDEAAERILAALLFIKPGKYAPTSKL